MNMKGRQQVKFKIMTSEHCTIVLKRRMSAHCAFHLSSFSFLLNTSRIYGVTLGQRHITNRANSKKNPILIFYLTRKKMKWSSTSLSSHIMFIIFGSLFLKFKVSYIYLCYYFNFKIKTTK